MLLKDKHAVVYGATGAVGAAVSKVFAREGARLFLTGRDPDAVEALAKEITAGGGTAEAAKVDALDERAVADHLDTVVDRAGRLDISFNAIGIPQQRMQGTPLTEMALADFTAPIETYAKAHFLTGRAAARRMISRGAGVVMMNTPTPSAVGIPLMGGMSPAWAAMESLNRQFSAEWAPHGVRAVCLRTTAMEETATIDVVFGLHAEAHGMTREEFAAVMTARTHRKRPTALSELAEAAAFAASDRASAMTGTIANLTAGFIAD